jgi:predicted transposase/invertase (TIGR01784 family)
METLYSQDQIFIPLISDYGFKATFGNEANTLFLRRALQALIKSETPIMDVKFDKNTFEGITQDGRSGIFDLACIDENDNNFIVEMQYGDAPDFIQRMKFYALHKFNAIVKKGKFDYTNLSKIYCVGILANNINPFNDYHQVSNLRNEKGELIDNQMSFVTIELDKFSLQESSCQTDLQKLIYTMKTIHTFTKPTQFPQFWNEEWLKVAIDELDSRKMTPDEKASLEILIARNAEAVNKEKRQLQKMIANFLELNLLTVEQIAKSVGVSEDFVLSVQRQLSNK